MKRWFAANRLGLSGFRNGRKVRKPEFGNRIVFVLVPFVLFCVLGLATVHASGGGGHEEQNDFVWRLVNFIILIGVLYWLLAKKVKEFFTGRREGIKTALAEAAAAREAAEKKFQEYDATLAKATGEIEAIGEMIKAQGMVEKERIIDDARKTAEKMREDAHARMEQEFVKASQELRIEAVRLSARMAEELLKKNIRADDHEAMVKDYIEKVVSKN